MNYCSFKIEKVNRMKLRQCPDLNTFSSSGSSNVNGNGNDDFVWPTSIMPLAPPSAKLGHHAKSRSQPALVSQLRDCLPDEPIYSEPLPPQAVSSSRYTQCHM